MGPKLVLKVFIEKKLAPPITRFAIAFLTLQCITPWKNALQGMLVSQEWTTSNRASKNEGKQVVNIVLCDDRF